MKAMINNWKYYIKANNHKLELILTISGIIIILIILSNFLHFIESRHGAILNDPILNILPSIDLTWLIFGFLYAGLILSVYELLKSPVLFVKAVQSYILMIVFRIISMYLMALDPPIGMIPLIDPIVEIFATSKTLTKDLFFSGHTATLFLLFLLIKKGILKMFLLIAVISVGLSVIIQHVHYTIDVLTAPFFAYSSYRIIKGKIPEN